MATKSRTCGMRAHRESGFSLLEMVVVLILSSILMAVVAMIMRFPIDAYYDTLRRGQLGNAAASAAARMSDEIRQGLPNSLRQHDFGQASNCIEFIPLAASAVYRQTAASDGSGDPLTFNVADNSFDLLSAGQLPDFSSATFHVVIYNLGIPGANAYDAASRASIAASGSSTSHIKLAQSRKFPLPSPNNVLHIIPDQSVIYSCHDGKLLRSTQTLSTTLPTSCPQTGTLMADRVAQCGFFYNQGSTANTGLLSLRIALQDKDEQLIIYRDIGVDNVP